MPKLVGEHNPQEQQKRIITSAEVYSLEGFYCIPLKPNDKRPRFPGWQKASGTVDHALKVIRNERACNLGIVLGEPSGLVDIDLDSEEARALAPLLLPATGMCINKAGMVTHYMYGCTDSGKTRKFQLPKTEADDGGMLLELRGTGGQTMVPPSVHPNGVVLEWDQGFNGARLLKYTQLEAQCRYLASAALICRYMANGVFHDAILCVAGGLYYSGMSYDGAKRVIKAIATVCGMEGLGDRLKALKSTYENGNKGMALRAWEALEEFGFDRAHIAKLKTWMPYNEAAFEEEAKTKRVKANRAATQDGPFWQDFDPLIGGSPVVQSTVELVGRFPVLAGNNKIIDLMRHPLSCIMPREVFKLIADTYTETKGKTRIGGYKIWTEMTDKQFIEAEDFNPAYGRIYEEHGRVVHNTYYMVKHDKPKKSKPLDPFLQHIDFLFPDAGDASTFLDWMAFNLQHPERRSLFTPLHISLSHGMGRSWLGVVLRRLMGDSLVVQGSMQDIMEGQFNNYLDKTLVCVIDEVAGHMQYTSNERLRNVLTEESAEVNVKYGAKRSQRIYTNFLMFSNHPDPIKITDNDRRLWVVRTHHKPKSGKYYRKLYRWIEKRGNIAALYWHLMGRDLTGFKALTRAPMTQAKKELITNTQSGPEMVVKEFVAENSEKIDIIAYSTLLEALERMALDLNMGGVFDEIKPVVARRILNEAGLRTVGRRLKIRAISTNLQQPWVLTERAQDLWANKDTAAIGRECARVHQLMASSLTEFDPES